MANKVNIKANCRTCINSNGVNDFMCFCSIYKIYRSTGIRMCNYYKNK